jgi:tetratricopeptide (TPR) repeat protein
MKSFIPFALLATTAIAPGQVLHPDARDRVTNPPQQQSNDTVIQRQPEEKKPAGSPFGNELPFLDPSSETVAWNGHTWAATDNRALAARFERYLNEPEDQSDAARDYRETIDTILELVSPHHPGGPDFPAAVKLLPRASSFPGDAKLCDSLTQAIYAAVLAKKDIAGTRALSSAIEEEKQRLMKDADWKARHEHDPSLNETKQTNGGGGGNNNGPGKAKAPAETPGRGVVSLQYVDAVRRIAEIEALKKANSAKNELQITQAKVQYQALMLQFFVQRRFEHVVMSSRFYHQIFQDGDNRLHIDKKSEVNKLFTESLGASPTVAALDSLASEAMRDVNQGVEAFTFLVEKKEYQSASKRLSEAYAVGEYMPAIRILPREQKRQVLEFVRESYKLIAALDAKDYTTAGDLTKKLKAMSGDFDATKAEAAIATYTRVSSMHIDAAKLAASKGDNDKAGQEIKNAMEVWPQNPKLAEFDKLVESGGGMAVAKNDFDRLLSEKNYREIFRRQYELAPAIAGDAAREDAFKQIITNLTRIEAALGKAAEFSKMDQDVAAWEQLATLRKEFPDDPNLGVEIEKLVSNGEKVATFTQALNRAREFEERRDKQVGAAMSWYLKARSIYPRSEMAESGIQRMLGEILPDKGSKDEAKAAKEE